MPSFDQTPGKPESFGYKISWFAVKASDPASVVEALGLGDAEPANWASGLAAVYEDGDPWVFVSPSVSGWVLAASCSWPYPTSETHHDIGKKFDLLFSRLMKRFDDVQFFGSYRVSGFTTWARAQNGKPTRLFAFGEDVLMNFGDQTPEEAKLGFVDLSGLPSDAATDKIYETADELDAETERLTTSGLSRRDARAKVQQDNGRAIPDEGDVLELAGLWSIDPFWLPEQDHPLGVGLAARLPEDLRQ